MVMRFSHPVIASEAWQSRTEWVIPHKIAYVLNEIATAQAPRNDDPNELEVTE